MDEDEVDFLENLDEVKQGNLDEWNSFVEYLSNNEFTNDAKLSELNQQIDTDHYLDYVFFNV